MKKILVALALALVVLVALGLLLPGEYTIERSITVQGPPERIHALVGDLDRWPEWTPWLEQDPTIRTTLGERTTGVGAHQSWTGESGDGELTVTRSDPATGIAYDMAFVAGDVRAPSAGTLEYRPAADGTTVVWTMRGDVGDFAPPVVDGYMSLLMKGSVGAMFDQGLANLKEAVEAGPADAGEAADDAAESVDPGE